MTNPPANHLANRRHAPHRLLMGLALAAGAVALAPGSIRPGRAGTPPAVAQVSTALPPAADARACPQLAGWKLAPDAVVADALANPTRYYGWQMPNNPAVPPGPYNPLRTYLSLAAPGKPYHPIYNNVIWKAGCP